jgi:heme iron utilization protein
VQVLYAACLHASLNGLIAVREEALASTSACARRLEPRDMIMTPSQASAFRSLLEGEQTAALATLHKGEPAVSMVPFALLPQGQGLVIHVSRLATHTADMLAHPSVALLVVAPAEAANSPQARPRVSIQGIADQCVADAPSHEQARHIYLSRFPESEEMFGFADFSLFVISVQSARYIGGFGQATTIMASEFASVMSQRVRGNPA